MKYYITLFFKCISESGKKYYSTSTLGCDIEFNNEAYEEVKKFFVESLEKSVKEKIISCESVFKDEYDSFKGKEVNVKVNLLEGQE